MSSQLSPMDPLSSSQQNQIAGQSLTLNKIPNPLGGQFNPQNLYNQYSGLMSNGGQSSTGLQPGISNIVTLDGYNNGPGLGRPPVTTGQNGQLPTHVETVKAQVPDYSQLFSSLNQYLNSMNSLLNQYQQ